MLQHKNMTKILSYTATYIYLVAAPLDPLIVPGGDGQHVYMVQQLRHGHILGQLDQESHYLYRVWYTNISIA